jgi:uncharacterized membrane protein YfcA
MEGVGYVASILIGMLLGLIGGGGSILTVPVLVYLFKIDAVMATTYSLFIVGVTSAMGSLNYIKQNLVSYSSVLLFGIPSIISVFVTRTYLLPFIPNELLTIGSLAITKSIFLMLLFALLMIVASYSMIRKGIQPPGTDAVSPIACNRTWMVMEGIAVGAITGLVGAGGGFIMIPVLVLVGKLPMKQAIGTSLIIIALSTIIGFLGEIHRVPIHWLFLLTLTGLAVLGICIGTTLSKKINGKKLKPAFGWFILIVGICILLKEIFDR